MRARLAVLSCACAAAVAALACHSFDGFGPTAGDAGPGPVEDAAVDGATDGGALDAATGDGASVTPDWSCLDAATPPPNPLASVDVTLHTIDVFESIVTAGSTGGSDLTLVSATPLPGVSARACTALDPACAATGTPAVQSDDAGVAHLLLPGGFDGVIQLRRPDLLTGTVYLDRLIDEAPSYPLPMINALEAASFGQQFGIALAEGPDAGLGHVFVTAYDCSDRKTPGISFRFEPTSPSTRTFYNDATTVLSITDTQTDRSGTGGAFNVPEGYVTVTATFAAGGETFRTSNVYVPSGGATLVLFRARAVP